VSDAIGKQSVCLIKHANRKLTYGHEVY